jgi:hypothetical protein
MNAKKTQLDPVQARATIEALREGAVPAVPLNLWSVGRSKWLDYVLDDLKKYIAAGGAKVRFVSGSYGDGKTHFLSMIQDAALEQGFAVAFIVLTREVSIQRFEQVYAAIARELCAPNAAQRGLRAALEAWISASLPAWLEEEGGDAAVLARLRAELTALPSLEPCFIDALLSLVRLHLISAAHGADDALTSQLAGLWRWFAGDRLSRAELKQHNLFEHLNKSNARRFLASLSSLCHYIGLSGLVVLCDELEIILSQSASARHGSYENVRLLIDNSDDAKYLHIFFSVIPDMLLSEKGFRAYDALWSRVRTLGDDQRINYRGVIMDLHRAPLSQAELIELARKLRALHIAAHGWDGAALDDATIIRICEQQEKAGLIGEVRLFIRQIVRALDVAEQARHEVSPAPQAPAALAPSWDS